MFFIRASSMSSEKLFWPFALPPRIYILLDGIPTLFATGRTNGSSPPSMNSRVHLVTSTACFSSNGVKYGDMGAKGVVRPRSECTSVI